MPSITGIFITGSRRNESELPYLLPRYPIPPVSSKIILSHRNDDDGGISQTLSIETFRGETDGVAAIRLPKDTFKKGPILERYHTRSELKKEVVDGKNRFDFELTSK
ncbi:hypothetical protein [Gimesia maris]|uniref:hypothetical protein n=1 Tax=Gimesia maris TaxID=122 RepID=UPI0030DAE231